MSIAAGTKLGHYEIHSKLGEGGMGEVYLAQDTKLDRKGPLQILECVIAIRKAQKRKEASIDDAYCEDATLLKRSKCSLQ